MRSSAKQEGSGLTCSGNDGSTTALPDPSELSTVSVCLESIRRANRLYCALHRHRLDAAEILKQKFAFAFWRMRVLNWLIENFSGGHGGDEDTLVTALGELRVHISEAQQARLSSAITDQRLFTRLMERQGVRPKGASGLSRAAGPQVNLKISANRSSHWPFERWRMLEALSEYAFEADGVRYRGILFRPGDMMLANCNLDGNGIYTTLSDPKNYCSHAAVFAILEHDGRRFPAVIETYEHGVRAVPLNVFLSPGFSSYTEIYRHRALEAEHVQRINRAAATMINHARGYNFDTEDPDRRYISCTSVGRFLLADAGLDPIERKSRITHPRIQKNLRMLGYTFFDFFAPVDYLLDSELSFVGWIDNGQLDRLLASELVESDFRSLFSQRDMNMARFPLRYTVNLWGLGHLRRRTSLGWIISRVAGFDHVSLPKGPDRTMAMVTLAEVQIGKVIRRVRPVVMRHLRTLTSLDLDSMKLDDEIGKLVRMELDLPWLR